MRRKLGGALALSLAVSAIHGAATWRGAADLPCGVLSPIDRLLCSPGPQSGPGAEAGGGGPSDNQGSEGGASPPPPATSSPPPAPQYVPDLLNVRFKPRTPAAAVRDELERARVTEYRRIPQIGVYVVRVAPERRAAALASLQASRWVTRAERGVFLHALRTNPNDADWPSQWGLRTVGAPLAWELTRGSSAVVVAVLDTGADEAHPDLRGAFVAGTDLVNGDEAPGDDHGHGTAVAGIIAARTNNRVGIAGICWACLVMPIKVLDSTGTGDDSTIAAGIVEAVDAGAFVINMSFGGPDTTAALGDAIVYAQSKGVVLVVAAGNTGTTEPFYPAAYPGVLSVAATDASDRLYPWSSRGSWVALAAPGCNAAPLRGGAYGEFCGTSAAAPIVTGVVALALSLRPDATSAEIARAIETTAAPLPDGVRYGRVRADAALAALAPTRQKGVQAIATFNGRVSDRSPQAYRLTVASGSLSARLTFSGAPALTVTLRTSGGRRVAVARGGSPLVLTRAVAAGTYRLEVGGARTPARFRLVVTYDRP